MRNDNGAPSPRRPEFPSPFRHITSYRSPVLKAKAPPVNMQHEDKLASPAAEVNASKI